jgi:hypothetical protein
MPEMSDSMPNKQTWWPGHFVKYQPKTCRSTLEKYPQVVTKYYRFHFLVLHSCTEVAILCILPHFQCNIQLHNQWNESINNPSLFSCNFSRFKLIMIGTMHTCKKDRDYAKLQMTTISDSIFLRNTVQTQTCTYTRIHSSLWMHTRTLYPYEHIRKTKPAD